MKKVIVIGAGASGLMAAITAARGGASVTVLEGTEKPGKKLAITGSGKCNLTNLSPNPEQGYRGAETEFLKEVLRQFSPEQTVAFFESIGLLTTSRQEYVYPYCGQAASVVSALLLEARRLDVKIKCMEKVCALKEERGRWLAKTPSWQYEGDAVILCAGSKAAPQTGSDGSGYDLAQMCGHTIRQVLPALVPLTVSESWIRKLAGLRMNARVTLCVQEPEGEKRFAQSGELQWTDYGISGIVVFQLSRHAAKALSEKKRVSVRIDLFPQWSVPALANYFMERKKTGSLQEFLQGTLPQKAIRPLLEQLPLDPQRNVCCLKEEEFWHLAAFLKEILLNIRETRSFDQAQICCGGADTAQVDPATMESRIKTGLYLAGEVLDVDGLCGGYNLQWAWSSGFVAGKSSAKE